MQPPGAEERVLPLLAVACTDSEQEGRDALVLASCSAIDRALERRFATPASFDELYLSPIAVCDDEKEDALCVEWATGQMRRLEPFSAGIQLATLPLVRGSCCLRSR
ncbi:hypothetical protein ABZZ74_21880 [Streptomyces sp. NPDC006476]|uniref:hypothetical protein n=1 Tax=Streptomyces sp. NPDC006476 TaxID=3157175 RepID=UPI0033B2DDE9